MHTMWIFGGLINSQAAEFTKMKRPNIPSPVVLIVGITIVFITVYMFSLILTKIDLHTGQTHAEHLFTKVEFHNIQGIFVVVGGMLGAFITSILSPKNEMSKAITLGIIIVIFAVIGVIRSKTQTLFDTTHLIIFIFTIPSMLLIAYLVKRKREAA